MHCSVNKWDKGSEIFYIRLLLYINLWLAKWFGWLGLNGNIWLTYNPNLNKVGLLQKSSSGYLTIIQWGFVFCVLVCCTLWLKLMKRPWTITCSNWPHRLETFSPWLLWSLWFLFASFVHTPPCILLLPSLLPLVQPQFLFWLGTEQGRRGCEHLCFSMLTHDDNGVDGAF